MSWLRTWVIARRIILTWWRINIAPSLPPTATSQSKKIYAKHWSLSLSNKIVSLPWKCSPAALGWLVANWANQKFEQMEVACFSVRLFSQNWFPYFFLCCYCEPRWWCSHRGLIKIFESLNKRWVKGVIILAQAVPNSWFEENVFVLPWNAGKKDDHEDSANEREYRSWRQVLQNKEGGGWEGGREKESSLVTELAKWKYNKSEMNFS